MGNKSPSPSPSFREKKESVVKLTQSPMYSPCMSIEEAKEHVRVHGVRAAVLLLHSEPAIVKGEKEGELVANPVCDAIIQSLGDLARSVRTKKDETPGNKHGQYIEFGVANYIRDVVIDVCDDLLLEGTSLRELDEGPSSAEKNQRHAPTEDKVEQVHRELFHGNGEARGRDKVRALLSFRRTLSSVKAPPLSLLQSPLV